ncbi:tyrosine-type recombinase/integrase [Photobacterium phosphoreum]|uniref:Tyrosine-type recombinase/integrase n=1 Tax=Photobacterium phosphoreum TaxID=659 RepID=A0AAW4ZSU2_PHOPO|nr:tyrosine-type recombinase/integrase [Photobacterium phosphoreum]MCD9491375.1 tyrosine-type recombinase/integrase [Photobacterium phosphoreum]MCD9502415.1 tyrosine-type recombinase/integrase [Photobacterium phosphoreum]MCF2190641.1 tyrosine-type recombinase/integrase [Photobacterium phosphoreum]MCF2302172.1 tyrosine-type recombinase/integrase [Photobacterium phosphoreum]
MSIKSIPSGYEVDCRPQGRSGKRYRKKFKTKSEAIHFERWLISTKNQKEWVNKTKEKRSFRVLIELWFKYHGQQLKSGEKDVKHLLKLDDELGNPKACDVTKTLFSDYRANQLTKGRKATTINRNHYRLSSVFTVLIQSGEINCDHPLQDFLQLKEPSREMGFLSIDEIKILLAALDGDALKIAKLSLATGARWGEAANLKNSHLVSGKVIYVNTKNGKNRTVPIKSELFNEIATGKSGNVFKPCYKEFYQILKSLNFDLPKGQAVHVLRHTFASHFIMNGGNVLILQKILGHSSILQTMKYAHLAPNYLNDAMELNPLSTL